MRHRNDPVRACSERSHFNAVEFQTVMFYLREVPGRYGELKRRGLPLTAIDRRIRRRVRLFIWLVRLSGLERVAQSITDAWKAGEDEK